MPTALGLRQAPRLASNAWPAPTPSRNTLAPRALLAPPARRFRSIKTKIDIGRKQQMAEAKALEKSLKLPLIFITPPVSSWPRSPKKFLHFLKTWFLARYSNLMTVFMVWKASMPSLFRFSEARYKSRRSQVVREAEDLHRRLFTAVAQGNTAEIAAVAVPVLARQYTTVVALRPKNKTVEWDLLGYKKSSNLRDHKLAPRSDGGYMRQAVVAIYSRQMIVERVKSAKKGVDDEVKQRLVEVKENWVVVGDVSRETFQTKTWRLWGTVPATDIEEYEREKATILMLQAAKSW